jgi:hypothetical protein
VKVITTICRSCGRDRGQPHWPDCPAAEAQNAALEEAAKVAEDEAGRIIEPANPRSACNRIAATIRAKKGE